MADPGAASLILGALTDTTLKATLTMSLAGGVLFASRRASASLRQAVGVTALLGVPVLLGLTWAEGPAALGISSAATQLLLGIWCAGLLASWIRLGRSVASVRGLVSRAERVDDPSWGGSLPSATRVVLSTETRVPFTTGHLRPVIVLPAEASSWPAVERHSVLAHEAAHVARADWLLHMASWLAGSLLWFHPIVWWLRRRVCLETELAADERVLRGGVSPIAYAEHLLARCEASQPAVAAVALLRASQLEERLRRIVGSAPRRAPKLLVIGVCGTLAACTLPLGTASVLPEGAMADLGTSGCNTTEGLANQAVPFSGVVDPEWMKEAAGILVRNCPHRRASVQIVQTIRLTLERNNPADWSTDAALRSEHAEALRQSRVLVSRLDTLGVADLPTPGPEDHLGRSLVSGEAYVSTRGSTIDPHVLTTSELEREADPIHATQKTVGAVLDVVARIDDDIYDRIQGAADAFENGALVTEAELLTLEAALDAVQRASEQVYERCEDDAPESAGCRTQALREDMLRIKKLLRDFGDTSC